MEQEILNLRNKVGMLSELSSQAEGLKVTVSDLRSEVEMHKTMLEDRNRRIINFEDEVAKLRELNTVVS